MFFFCCQHDQLACDKCKSESHQTCSSIVSIEKAAENVKDGRILSELEKSIDNLVERIGVILKNKTNPSGHDTRVKIEIKKRVHDVKQQLVLHLEKLENQLSDDIDVKVPKFGQSESRDMKKLQKTLKTVDGWKKDLKSLKEITSETYLFQVIKFIDKEVHNQTSEVAKCSANKQILTFKPSKAVLNYQTVFPSLGKLEIKPLLKTTTMNVERKQQAQVPLRIPRKRLTFVRSFKSTDLNINDRLSSGCFMSANILLLKTQLGPVLYLCNLDRSDSKQIRLSYNPECITKFDNNRALVSSVENYIQVINIASRKPETKIMIKGEHCTDLCSLNGKIWVRSDHNTLIAVDIDGNELSKITTSFDPNDMCVHRSGDLYFISERNAIFVMGSDEKPYRISKFPKQQNPYDVHLSGLIVVDDDLLVAGMTDNNIYKISIDDGNHAIVLTEDDGIKEPIGLSYNSETNELLVVNNRGLSIYFFKVI